MPIDFSCQIPKLGNTSEIDTLAPNTVLVLALGPDGVLRPISTGKADVRKITESELRQLRACLQAFPDTFTISKVETALGCQVVSDSSGGGIFIPCAP